MSYYKYVPNHLIRLLYNFYFIFHSSYLIIKKANSENVSTPEGNHFHHVFDSKNGGSHEIQSTVPLNKTKYPFCLSSHLSNSTSSIF